MTIPDCFCSYCIHPFIPIRGCFSREILCRKEIFYTRIVVVNDKDEHMVPAGTTSETTSNGNNTIAEGSMIVHPTSLLLRHFIITANAGL